MANVFRRVAGLLCMLAFACAAKAQGVGQWIYKNSEPDYYAGTLNDSGNGFGQHCSPGEGSCVYFIGLSTRCEDGEDYPALLSSDFGAYSVNLTCQGRTPDGKMHRYVISPFKDVDSAVRNSKRIGIALALEGDQFRVVRFSLDGAVAAITIIRSGAERSMQRRDTTNTKDKVL